MRIVLTGNEGFIGNHYERYVKGTEDEIIQTWDVQNGVMEDLCDYEKVLWDIEPCDAVVHLAATNGTKKFYKEPTEVLLNNTLSTINLIQALQGCTSTKFVFASTCEIFNSAVDEGYPIPSPENMPVMFTDITNPRWSYSLPKALGENLVANCGNPYLILRYFNIYGPGQKDHFIPEFIERCKKGEYWVQGHDTRSFCYIDDAIEITHRLVTNCENEIVNVGCNAESYISTIATEIMDIMGISTSKLEIKGDSPDGSVSRRCPHVTKMKELTGWSQKDYTPLREGLEKTVESML